MFYDTKIEIYETPDSYSSKTIYADVQPFSGSLGFNLGISLEISKRVFCDLDKDINEEAYFGIEDHLYKVLNIKERSDYMEVFIYKCKRQVS